jgi:hypothetical protein
MIVITKSTAEHTPMWQINRPTHERVSWSGGTLPDGRVRVCVHYDDGTVTENIDYPLLMGPLIILPRTI